MTEWNVYQGMLHLFRRLNNSYLLCNKLAAQCTTCGKEACISLHRGIDLIASLRLGDRPNWMFCTSTFSKDCKKHSIWDTRLSKQ